MSKNYITTAGAEQLKAELKKTLTIDRPELVRVVQWAASNGDRSENADYTYGKRKLRELDRKIRFLTKRLEAAEIIDPKQQKKDQVLFGATVTFVNEEGLEKTYQIVGQDEIDLKKGQISWISPVAKALLNKRIGDFVQLTTPRGSEQIQIMNIQYI